MSLITPEKFAGRDWGGGGIYIEVWNFCERRILKSFSCFFIFFLCRIICSLIRNRKLYVYNRSFRLLLIYYWIMFFCMIQLSFLTLLPKIFRTRVKLFEWLLLFDFFCMFKPYFSKTRGRGGMLPSSGGGVDSLWVNIDTGSNTNNE